MMKPTATQFKMFTQACLDLLDYSASHPGVLPGIGLCQAITGMQEKRYKNPPWLVSGYVVIDDILDSGEYQALGPPKVMTEDRLNFLLFLSQLTYADYVGYFWEE